MATFATSTNQLAALKELYSDDKDYMQNIVYSENPLFALMPKDESPNGMGGKYLPVPIQYGVPQGVGHSFATAQSNQTATQLASFFVYVISHYGIVTITNLLMEQTKSDIGAFVDAAKLQMDGVYRSLTNAICFELFGDGSGQRGSIGSTNSGSAPTYVITLADAQTVVNFEVGMTLVNFVYSGGSISSISSTTAAITAVDRANGILTVLASSTDASWASAGNYLGISGDIVAGQVGTGTAEVLMGLGAWIPKTSPASNDAFWGVNRSSDPTRLAGLRYDASAYTVEEGIINALAFGNREGAKFDIIVMDFASYSALQLTLGAKAQYIQASHDEVEVSFDGLVFQSAYGKVTVLPDRSCPSKTAYALKLDTWKLRSLGKIPHVLTYGLEGLEGLRVGNADALEIRIGYYGQLVCSAPGRNMVIQLSA